MTAIGYSANVVAPESTLIIVRAGGDNAISVEEQLLDAVDQFFPGAGFIESVEAMGLEIPQSARNRITSEPPPANLKSLNTPKSNYILVINGIALGYVRA